MVWVEFFLPLQNRYAATADHGHMEVRSSHSLLFLYKVRPETYKQRGTAEVPPTGAVSFW